MALIEVKDLSLKFNEKENMILNHVSFSIEKGEFVSIVGHNGSGKSTLAKAIVGLLEPTSGEIKIEIDDKKVTKKIGYVFQNPDNQFVGITVADDIAFGLENRMVKQSEMDPIIDDVLAKVDMTKYKKFEPHNLSGGQKQRVAIASNLALSLSAIIFDESTSMLDPKGKEEINNVIGLLRKQNPDLTIIQITHDMDEVLPSDRVIALKNGEVICIEKPDNFFKNAAVLKDLGILAPFKYRLLELLNSKNINANISDSYEEIRRKIDEHRD